MIHLIMVCEGISDIFHKSGVEILKRKRCIVLLWTYVWFVKMSAYILRAFKICYNFKSLHF